MTESMPELYDLGSLRDFSFDVATQSLSVVLTVMPVHDGDYYRLVARFQRIIVFDFECAIPVLLSSESGCDEFRELTSSKLLGSVTRSGEWTVLSRADRSRIVYGDVAPSGFRHFRLYGSALWAEWLCADAEFVLDDEPMPSAISGVSADRDPFA